jgi:hypothetical protein
MKSNKQKRAELEARRAVKREAAALKARREVEARRRRVLEGALERGAVAVNPARLVGARYGYSVPEFLERGVYEPVPFICKSCGRQEVWTPHQQKWWYETAGGDCFSTATMCRPCRARERARKAEARRVRAEGLAKKVEGRAKRAT